MLHRSHVGGGAIDFGQLVSTEHTDLIEFEQLADSFRVASSRRIQEFAALIHLFFFGMRSSSSFHAHPSSTQAGRLTRSGLLRSNPPGLKLPKYIRIMMFFGISNVARLCDVFIKALAHAEGAGPGISLLSTIARTGISIHIPLHRRDVP